MIKLTGSFRASTATTFSNLPIGYMSYEITGTTSQSPSFGNSLAQLALPLATYAYGSRCSAEFVTSLGAGTYTFTAKYCISVAGTGDVEFDDRIIIVQVF
jgi:hypothetical protein